MHHRAVDVAVNLGEIERPEVLFDIELVQAITQARVVRPERHGAIGSRGLKINIKTLLLAECEQRGDIVFTQRIEVTEAQRHRLVARGHLHLRNTDVGVETAQQRAQREQVLARLGLQDLAVCEIGEIGAALFANPHQHGLLLFDELRAEARAPAIAPMRTRERWQDFVGLEVTDMAEIVEQDLLFHVDLRIGAKFVEKKQAMLVWIREKRSAYLADLAQCEVLHPKVGKNLLALRTLLRGLDAYNRIPQVEVAAGDEAVALVFRHLDPLSEHDVAALRTFGEQQGFYIYLQPAGPDSAVPLWPDDARLSYRLDEFDVELGFRPTDFTQVNGDINGAMVHRALELLEMNEHERVLDLFCGLGNFTLPIA